MPTKTEHLGTGAFLKSEGAGHISRDSIVIASGAGALLAGTVLGKVTASGKYLAHSPAGVDGTQNAAAVLLADVDATSADAEGVGILRLAEVWKDRLVWGAGVTTTQHKTDALVELASTDVIGR